jgi:hypothetical protein
MTENVAAGRTMLASILFLAAACDAGSGSTAPAARAPEPKSPGGCSYEERAGKCRLIRHETTSAGDGVFDNVVVRGTFEWTASPPGVTGVVEWRTTRDRAPAAESHLLSHPEAPCSAVVLMTGSCPPQSSHVSRIDIAPP